MLWPFDKGNRKAERTLRFLVYVIILVHWKYVYVFISTKGMRLEKSVPARNTSRRLQHSLWDFVEGKRPKKKFQELVISSFSPVLREEKKVTWRWSSYAPRLPKCVLFSVSSWWIVFRWKKNPVVHAIISQSHLFLPFGFSSLRLLLPFFSSLFSLLNLKSSLGACCWHFEWRHASRPTFHRVRLAHPEWSAATIGRLCISPTTKKWHNSIIYEAKKKKE